MVACHALCQSKFLAGRYAGMDSIGKTTEPCSHQARGRTDPQSLQRPSGAGPTGMRNRMASTNRYSPSLQPDHRQRRRRCRPMAGRHSLCVRRGMPTLQEHQSTLQSQNQVRCSLLTDSPALLACASSRCPQQSRACKVRHRLLLGAHPESSIPSHPALQSSQQATERTQLSSPNPATVIRHAELQSWHRQLHDRLQQETCSSAQHGNLRTQLRPADGPKPSQTYLGWPGCLQGVGSARRAAPGPAPAAG